MLVGSPMLFIWTVGQDRNASHEGKRTNRPLNTSHPGHYALGSIYRHPRGPDPQHGRAFGLDHFFRTEPSAVVLSLCTTHIIEDQEHKASTLLESSDIGRIKVSQTWKNAAHH